VIVCEPGALMDVPIVLDSTHFEVEETAPSVIVWRVRPGIPLGESVAPRDQAFAKNGRPRGERSTVSLSSVRLQVSPRDGQRRAGVPVLRNVG
jgi:hypothetical protein